MVTVGRMKTVTQIQKKHELQESEYSDSFCDVFLDLEQSDYEKECDLMDRKCEDWVKTKTEEK